jgi:hypothetical protein
MPNKQSASREHLTPKGNINTFLYEERDNQYRLRVIGPDPEDPQDDQLYDGNAALRDADAIVQRHYPHDCSGCPDWNFGQGTNLRPRLP